jgi:hypothetical protein
MPRTSIVILTGSDIWKGTFNKATCREDFPKKIINLMFKLIKSGKVEPDYTFTLNRGFKGEDSYLY